MDDTEVFRFSYELKLQQDVQSRFNLPTLDDSVVAEYLSIRRQTLLSDSIHITADLLPKVYKTYQECLNRVGLSGELFVQQSSDMNANIFGHEGMFDIVVTSKLVNNFSIDELKFVFGHELGHIKLKHCGNIYTEIFKESFESDPMKFFRVLCLCRACEISADRFGLDCCGNLESCISALFKLASGLFNVSTQQVITSFRNQYELLVDQLQSNRTCNLVSKVRTHPMVPIRFKALELIALDLLALGKNLKKGKSFKDVDRQIGWILESIDNY